jgi:hypothetical protein
LFDYGAGIGGHHQTMHQQIRLLALATALFGSALLSCSPVTGASPTPAASTRATVAASPAATAARSTQVLLAGTITTAEATREQYTHFADRGSLYAISTRDGPSPYLSKIERFDTSAGAWRQVFQDDAHFSTAKPSAGRLALFEYREPFQGGGANDQTLLVLDLSTGVATKIDFYALSMATYHGGGGGPRGPRAGVAIGGDTTAWSRVNELPGGITEGELRVAKISDPARFTTIGRSRASIEPLWIDGSTLTYLVGGPDRDEIRARDLATGVERNIVSLAPPGVTAPREELSRSGDIIGWTEQQSVRGAPTFLRTVDAISGAKRELDLGSDFCYGTSGNKLGFVWACKSSSPQTVLSYFDPRAWRTVELVRSQDRPNDFQALENAFLWYDVVNGTRRANLLVLP